MCSIVSLFFFFWWWELLLFSHLFHHYCAVWCCVIITSWFWCFVFSFLPLFFFFFILLYSYSSSFPLLLLFLFLFLLHAYMHHHTLLLLPKKNLFFILQEIQQQTTQEKEERIRSSTKTTNTKKKKKNKTTVVVVVTKKLKETIHDRFNCNYSNYLYEDIVNIKCFIWIIIDTRYSGKSFGCLGWVFFFLLSEFELTVLGVRALYPHCRETSPGSNGRHSLEEGSKVILTRGPIRGGNDGKADAAGKEGLTTPSSFAPLFGDRLGALGWTLVLAQTRGKRPAVATNESEKATALAMTADDENGETLTLTWTQ